MRIAVITPYCKEADQVLEQCHRSVLDQTITCDRFLIADGFPNPTVEGWRAKKFELPDAQGHGGNWPCVLGSISAFNQGYDAVAFLDADNWYPPDNLERLVDLHARTGAAVCTAGRTMHRLDGSYMFDDDKNNGRSHVIQAAGS
jgi:glycosyltransferase involved in cell wall biosynthesis